MDVQKPRLFDIMGAQERISAGLRKKYRIERDVTMISHGKDLKIFAGNSNRPLAQAICKELRLPLGNMECGSFSDGECFVSI